MIIYKARISMNGHLQLQRNCYYIIGMRHTYNHIRGVGNHLRYFSASIDSLACIVAIRCLQHGPPWLVLRGRSGVTIGYGYPKGISLKPTFSVPVAYGYARTAPKD